MRALARTQTGSPAGAGKAEPFAVTGRTSAARPARPAMRASAERALVVNAWGCESDQACGVAAMDPTQTLYDLIAYSGLCPRFSHAARQVPLAS